MKKTLVIGASENPDRYSNKAIRSLRNHGHEVKAVGNKAGQILDVIFSKELPSDKDIDTVTLYLNPQNQEAYYSYILALKPKRIILNPGAENKDFEILTTQNGISSIEACTLVLLATGQY